MENIRTLQYMAHTVYDNDLQKQTKNKVAEDCTGAPSMKFNLSWTQKKRTVWSREYLYVISGRSKVENPKRRFRGQL